MLHLVEVDPEGRAVFESSYDADDLDSAFDELDRRFAEGEAAGAPEAWQAVQDVVRSHNTKNKDLFVSQARDVATAVDHRRLGWGKSKGRQFERTANTSIKDSTMRCVAVPRVAPNGIVAVLATMGTVPLRGGTWESDFVLVAEVGVGSAWNLEFFAVEDLERALERFDEITSLRSVVMPNLAQLAANEGLRRVEAHEYDELGALFSEDAVVDDRRAGVRSVIRGRDAVIPSLRAISGVTETKPRLVATRGDRLALGTIVWRGVSDPGGAFEVELLSMTELNADGLITAVVLFDADDRDGGYRNLNARFRAGEGAPYAATLDLGTALGDRWSERDWEAVRDLFAPGAAVVDHRHLGWGEVDVAGFIARARMLTDMAPDARLYSVATPRLDERGSVAVLIGEGTTADGTHFEMCWVMLLLVHGDRIARVEMFPLDQLEVAVASFDRYTPDLTAG